MCQWKGQIDGGLLHNCRRIRKEGAMGCWKVEPETRGCGSVSRGVWVQTWGCAVTWLCWSRVTSHLSTFSCVTSDLSQVSSRLCFSLVQAGSNQTRWTLLTDESQSHQGRAQSQRCTFVFDGGKRPTCHCLHWLVRFSGSVTCFYTVWHEGLMSDKVHMVVTYDSEFQSKQLLNAYCQV